MRISWESRTAGDYSTGIQPWIVADFVRVAAPGKAGFSGETNTSQEKGADRTSQKMVK
jgi:hypothetical protein